MEDIAQEKTPQNPEPQTPQADATEPRADSDAAPDESKVQADSGNFLRCSHCIHAEGVDISAGTLLCHKHNMQVNAEADEIPDDCVEFDERPPASGQ